MGAVSTIEKTVKFFTTQGETGDIHIDAIDVVVSWVLASISQNRSSSRDGSPYGKCTVENWKKTYKSFENFTALKAGLYAIPTVFEGDIAKMPGAFSSVIKCGLVFKGYAGLEKKTVAGLDSARWGLSFVDAGLKLYNYKKLSGAELVLFGGIALFTLHMFVTNTLKAFGHEYRASKKAYDGVVTENRVGWLATAIIGAHFIDYWHGN